jgi:uncharacterized protein
MSESSNAALAPVAARARIEILDVLRGLAILGIFYINVPYMAAPIWQFSLDIRSIGWTAPDQNAWALIAVFLNGTQRGLLQFLFGAGMMVLAGKAMTPDGPVAVSDLYYRRNFWLLAFGLFDVFVLLWPGDILHIYALAALFLFPFRTLSPRWLLAIGLGWAAMVAVGIPDHGAREYVSRTELVQHVDEAHARQQHAQALSAGDRAALTEWQKLIDNSKPSAEMRRRIASERAAHAGGFIPYAREAWNYWSILATDWLVWDVIEAFCTMLIGVALWKWRIIQGGRSRRFYLWLMIGAYGFGVSARIIGIGETLSFGFGPRTIWITGEFARLSIALGHLALVNLAVRTLVGSRMLSVIKAPGRMAFSLYFLGTFIGKYILFAPFALNLWGRFGWAQMAGISTLFVIGLTIFANLWMRSFVSGPLEWAWRSLAYVKLQPFRRAAISAPPLPDRSPQGPWAGGSAEPAGSRQA